MAATSTLRGGIDLGGTKIAGAVWDSETASILERKTIPTQGHLGPDGVIVGLEFTSLSGTHKSAPPPPPDAAADGTTSDDEP